MLNPRIAPSPDELGGFLLGKLSAPDAERMIAWVNANANAAEALRAIPAQDALTADLAASQTVPPLPAKVERLLQAVPQSHPFGPTLAPTTPEGMRVAPYRIIRELGRGGMGVVYEAMDERLGRRAAIKVLNPALAADTLYRERFLREARAVAGLKSDHVVIVYQADEAGGILYLAMEYLEGSTLGDWREQREGRLTTAEVVSVARDVLRGLAVAHARGIVHRDIKPGNLWVERETGRVKVLDFGLARGSEIGSTITGAGQVCGTPEYVSPEQAEGKAVDCRSDLFSLGVVLYQLVTGESPFRRDTVWATLAAVGRVELPRLTRVPEDLSRFIAQLMSKNPAGRPADAADALARLQAIENPREKQPRRSQRGRLKVVVGLAALLLIGVITLWACGVFRVKTPEGVLVIEVNEPGAEVYVDGTKMRVTWGKDRHTAEIAVRAGTHKVELKKDGFVIFGEEVELLDGKRRVLKATLIPRPPRSPGRRITVNTDTHGFENLFGVPWRDNETITRGSTGTWITIDEERQLCRVRLDKHPKEEVWIPRRLVNFAAE